MNTTQFNLAALALCVATGCAANGVSHKSPTVAVDPFAGAPDFGGAGGVTGTAGTAAAAAAGSFAAPSAGDTDIDAGDALSGGSDAANLLLDSCKKSSVESTLLPANILFVLDRSGSMECNPPPTTDSVACEQMPVRTASDMPSKWEITTQALIDAIPGLPASATVGVSYFSNDDQCGVNATPSVPLLANTAAQRDAIAKSLHGVKPGGGTPIVGATILAYAYMHKAALDGAIFGNQFVVLITDGAQSEMCSYAPRCSDAASCISLLVDQEVPKAAGPGVGIRSFVVGVPGSEPSRTVLSQIAKQGGTAPEGCDPQQGNCHFDMTTAKDLGAALGAALAKIAGQAITCELDVPSPDKGDLDITRVNVVYTPGGSREPVLVRQDADKPCASGANGWQYSDMNRKIRLCGKVCDTIRKDDGAKVDVVLGCPSLLQ